MTTSHPPKPFWITHISVGGHMDRPLSTVQFAPGLNVVCGPSNSGKTWVLQAIDYIFGLAPESFEITESLGYQYVEMGIQTAQGTITAHRTIGEGSNRISIQSTDLRVLSGEYSLAGNAKTIEPISHVWLRLIGFEDPGVFRVIKNANYEIQAFTWRTFWHYFYGDEDRISSKKPILAPSTPSANTAARCALATLLTGINFAELARTEQPEVKKLHNNAVIEFLRPQPKAIEERIDKLKDQLSNIENSDESQFDIENEIQIVQEKIDSWRQEATEVVARFHQLTQSLAENDALLGKYAELYESYTARINRIDFLRDGSRVINTYEVAPDCPVCGQDLPEHLAQQIFHADETERETILAQQSDLEVTMAALHEEQERIATERTKQNEKAKSIVTLLNETLEPELERLRSAHDIQTAIIKISEEIAALEHQRQEVKDELERREALTFPKGTFKAAEQLPEAFQSDFESKIRDVLNACAFPDIREVTFSLGTWDTIVNKRAKRSYGKGYRSLINACMLLALREYMAENSQYKPPILLLDTPLLGFDDPQLGASQEVLETVPLALYDYLAERQDFGQMIVSDNLKFMPEIDKIAQTANIIRFSKELDANRYGFLAEATDENLVDQEQDDEQNN